MLTWKMDEDRERDNISVDVKEIGFEVGKWVELAHVRVQWCKCISGVELKDSAVRSLVTGGLEREVC
jgi:hypothetical protein